MSQKTHYKFIRWISPDLIEAAKGKGSPSIVPASAAIEDGPSPEKRAADRLAKRSINYHERDARYSGRTSTNVADE